MATLTASQAMPAAAQRAQLQGPYAPERNSRTWAVNAEKRSLPCAAQNRATTIAPQSRAYLIT